MRDGERTRQIVALVLESFRGVDLASLCRGTPFEPEEIAAFRTAFVDAGTARVHDASNPRSWLQVNVTLDPPGPQWIRLMVGPLAERVRGLLDDGTAEEFHFVHKPPGARIRLLGARERLVPAIESMMTEMVHDGHIKAFTRGAYDAEVHQFGGEDGLAAAHAFFTAESLAVLGFHRLRLEKRSSIGSPEFSLLLLDLFLRGVTGDEWELWDLWCNMELTGRGMNLEGEERARVASQATAAGQVLADVLRGSDDPLARLPQAEQGLLLDYRRRVAGVAPRMRALHAEGKLLFPLREILPFWVIFHFNRMGFSASEQRFLSLLMTSILSPKGGQTRPVAAVHGAA